MASLWILSRTKTGTRLTGIFVELQKPHSRAKLASGRLFTPCFDRYDFLKIRELYTKVLRQFIF